MHKRPGVASAITIGIMAYTFSATASGADEYPNRPVRIVVPYPAGGSVDPPARIIAQQLSQQTGRQFIVENRAGAGGNIGTEHVATAPADGYTLLFSGSNIVIGPSLMRETVRYNPVTSFAHVGRVVTIASGFVVNANSRFRTLGDVLAHARANPGKLSYGFPGAGSPAQLAMELFKRATNVDIRPIPYKGAAPALTDLLGDQIDIVAAAMSATMGQIKGGRLRALAVTSVKRDPQLPDVPSVSETVAGFDVVTWLGLSAPAGLPAAIEARLGAELERAANDAAVMQSLRAGGMTPAWSDSRQMSAMVRAEFEMYRKVIEDARIKPE